MEQARTDYVKSVINIPRKMLTFLHIYPESQGKSTNFAFAIMWLCVGCLELGQVIYMVQNFTDVTEMASTCTTVSTSFQALCKLLILYLNLDNIKDMLSVFWLQFWPVDIVDTRLRNELRFSARLATWNMLVIYISGISFATEFLCLPLISGKRSLPFSSSLPFDWRKSPVYELTYVYQVFTNAVIIITTILGTDFLFVSLMLNAIAQFRILQYVIRKVGCNERQNLNEKLDAKIPEQNEKYFKCKDPDMTLLRRCIVHHITLLKFCDDLEKVFSAAVFIQYVASISAICMSSFLISLIEASSVWHLICFCVGHVFQLFLYCVVGNELVFQSRELATATFESNWYLTDNVQLRRNLILIIQRAQKPTKITALGFIDLNFESFVQVLKLSFSFHTLLSTINEK